MYSGSLRQLNADKAAILNKAPPRDYSKVFVAPREVIAGRKTYKRDKLQSPDQAESENIVEFL